MNKQQATKITKRLAMIESSASTLLRECSRVREELAQFSEPASESKAKQNPAAVLRMAYREKIKRQANG